MITTPYEDPSAHVSPNDARPRLVMAGPARLSALLLDEPSELSGDGPPALEESQIGMPFSILGLAVAHEDAVIRAVGMIE